MNKSSHLPIALWNPLWTIIWSFLFTPIFGAFLQRTNWSDMGEADETSTCGLWVFLGFVYMGGYLFAEPWLPESEFSEFYFFGSYLIVYILWIVTSGSLTLRRLKQKRPRSRALSILMRFSVFEKNLRLRKSASRKQEIC